MISALRRERMVRAMLTPLLASGPSRPRQGHRARGRRWRRQPRGDHGTAPGIGRRTDGQSPDRAAGVERPEAGTESAKPCARPRGQGGVRPRRFRPGAARETIEAADLIWMPGGDQNRLMAALQKADLVNAIRDRHRKGATVGGTSAGAAVQSGVMITGEAPLDTIRRGATVTADGLDLWPGVIVDQHFVRRQRFQRLLAAVLDRPQLVGVGIDEGTAAVGDRHEIRGDRHRSGVGDRRPQGDGGARQEGRPRRGDRRALHVLTPADDVRSRGPVTTSQSVMT